jgi:hypothetical protein
LRNKSLCNNSPAQKKFGTTLSKSFNPSMPLNESLVSQHKQMIRESPSHVNEPILANLDEIQNQFDSTAVTQCDDTISERSPLCGSVVVENQIQKQRLNRHKLTKRLTADVKQHYPGKSMSILSFPSSVKDVAENSDSNSSVSAGERRKRMDYSEEEIEYIKRGVRRFGTRWTMILLNYPFKKGRLATDLSSKFKMMKRQKKKLKQEEKNRMILHTAEP